MLWFILAIVLATPFFTGYFIGLIVFLTPGLDRKVTVAKFLIATPFRLFNEAVGAEVETEVEWIVRGRYGAHKAEYRDLLDVAWGRKKKK